MDYATLKVIWWLLVGVLLIGFAIMDGHDMGVGTLLPFVGKTDEERRVAINSIAPHWDGNQVWFLTGGGALFAAWPLIYAAAFSGFYWAMMLVLFALFFRPVGFDYRSKIQNPKWRNFWDWALFVGGFVPPIIFGVAFGNLLQGVNFAFDRDMILHFQDNLFHLLNPFALVCGLVSSAMVTMQGGTYLAHRTVGDIQSRTIKYTKLAVYAFIALFVAAGLWLKFGGMQGYGITSTVDPNGIANPLLKTVERTPDWFANYNANPLLWIFPLLAVGGALAAAMLVGRKKTLASFVASSLSVIGTIVTPAVAMFPFMMPSYNHMPSSLTVWDASSSHLTLGIMLGGVVIFVPIVLAYTSWAYRMMRGKITVDQIEAKDKYLY